MRSFLYPYLVACGGVLISVVLPPLAQAVKKSFRPTAGAVDFGRYALLALFSLVTGIIVLAVYRAAHPNGLITWPAALLAGYGWEATLEKFVPTN